MAKLIIFRGEAQIDERELKEQTVRIGRGAQNDLILEDPGKGVSRNHAEIRFEGGRYTLVDLQSQNGIWVSGTRVSSVVLEPGVSAALGPFRLMVPGPPPSPASTPPSSGIYPATEMTQLSERSAAPLKLDNLGLPEKPSSPPPPATPPSAAKPAAAKPSAAKGPVGKPALTTAQKTSGPKQGSQSNSRALGIVAAVVILVGLAGFIGYKLMGGKSQRPWDVPAATQLVDRLMSRRAGQVIRPALQANSTDQQALALQSRCTPPPPTTTAVTSSIPAGPTIDERLTDAEQKMSGNIVAECQTALDAINAVLTEDPNNDRAKGLLAKANACLARKPVEKPPVAGDKPAVPVSPGQGGLIPLQGETDKDYKIRINAMNKRYDDAVAQLSGQNYAQAMKALDAIVPDVPSGYRELAQRRDEARAGMRQEAKRLLSQAQAADQRDNFDVAIDLYHRAHQLDPSIPVDDQIKVINERKLAAGRGKCNDGKVALIYQNTALALTAFQETVRLLQGTSDPCLAFAKEQLQKLGK